MSNTKIIIALCLTVRVLTGCSATPYVKIGAGYKFRESEIAWRDGSKNDPISARIEAGLEKGNWSYGYSHHSQWFTGWPINNGIEYSKDEVFVDYKWTFGKTP